MMHLFRVVVLLAPVLALTLTGQTFTLIDADVSAFPRVRSQFIALDQAGYQYQNLQPSDFLVRENGRSMQATLQVTCEESKDDPTGEHRPHRRPK